MKAVVMTAVGGPDVLEVREVPMPVAGFGEILVRVKAAGVNPIDYKLRATGALGAGPGKILGFDGAGIVEKLGPGVTDFEVGENVYFSPEFANSGTYSQFVVVKRTTASVMPKSLNFAQAAAVPLVGTTAWDGLFARGELALGQTILVAAANGGVGSMAVQLAKAAGAFVYATCSARSMEFVKSIPTVRSAEGGATGPDRVLDYTRENWSQVIAEERKPVETRGLDLVFDCAGQDVVSRSIGLMKPFGRIVTIVNPTGKLDEAYRKNVTIHYEFLQRKRATLDILGTLLERKQIVPLIDSVMKLEEAAEAHRKLEAGGVRGKIVLEVE